MVGLPVAGIGTLFYAVLLLGMGATALWRWGLGLIQRIGKRWWPGAGEQIQALGLPGLPCIDDDGQHSTPLPLTIAPPDRKPYSSPV